MKGKCISTTNVIYTLGTIIERALEVQKKREISLHCIIDYTTAFDILFFLSFLSYLFQFLLLLQLFSGFFHSFLDSVPGLSFLPGRPYFYRLVFFSASLPQFLQVVATPSCPSPVLVVGTVWLATPFLWRGAFLSPAIVAYEMPVNCYTYNIAWDGFNPSSQCSFCPQVCVALVRPVLSRVAVMTSLALPLSDIIIRASSVVLYSFIFFL